MGCSWIGFQAVYGSQQLDGAILSANTMAAIAVRLGILEETHKTWVPSSVEQSVG